MLAGHASGGWLSALGAGVLYNRETKRESSLHPPPQVHWTGSESSLTNVPSLQTTGSPQETGFPQPLDKSLALLGQH